MKVHFIAIGGSAMHNLALALHHKKYVVTGSDDEINEPSKTRLAAKGLLPDKIGWFPDKITSDLHAVILGMHARADNPELVRAKELGLKIYSYPEYIYEQSKDKTRVVIGGSHGKTTITSMIMHVLKEDDLEFDFMVGAQLEGFETMVRLSHTAPVIILEGDEYLASPIDRRPKFHLYKADIALVSGIAWDHINVFPTFENYVEQFRIFVNNLPEGGTLIYPKSDELTFSVCKEVKHVHHLPYSTPLNFVKNGITYLGIEGESNAIPLSVFGEHNLLNLEGAKMVCMTLGFSENDFYTSISTFKGASRRLELLSAGDKHAIYRDFAHSPSKLEATTAAVKNQFDSRKLIACMELHTFSSLTANFLDEYSGSMDAADEAIVYFNPHTIEHKKLPPLTDEQVKKAFGRRDLIVFTDSNLLRSYLESKSLKNANLLLMSSGTFDGIDLSTFAKALSGHEKN